MDVTSDREQHEQVERRAAPQRSRHPAPGPSGTPHLSGWDVVRPLSHGAQAHTYLVRRAGETDGELYVAKVLRLVSSAGAPLHTDQQRWRFVRETTALRTLGRAQCPGIPRLIEAHLLTRGDERPFFVMPYYTGGPMCQRDEHDRVIRWAEPYRGDIDRVLEIAEALARTLACMHTHDPGVVHKDINTGNILLATPGGEPVLADFGIIYLDDYTGRPDIGGGEGSGPWRWRPPELSRGDWYTPVTGTDVFMLGGVIFDALTGGEYLPAAVSWRHEAPLGEIRDRLRDATDDERVPAVAALLGRMLAPDPRDRPDAADVVELCRTARIGTA